MRAKPGRVVDAHVHLWDPARTDWYPYLTPRADGPVDMSRMNRRFDVATYRTEAAQWNVEKIINVAAATGANSVDETIELDRNAGAAGGPDAIIGGLPPTDTIADAIALLDRQMTAPRFRGVRAMGGLDRPVPEDEVLGAMRDRGLVFELMARPDQLHAAAGRLEGFDDLPTVVEHTGWPRSASDDERVLWKSGIGALAALGPNVHCKLSGLAMPFQSTQRDALAPWIEYAIEAFGVDRCFFASNFPVDSVHGSFDDLYTTFNEVTAGLDPASREQLFAGNAERFYRL